MTIKLNGFDAALSCISEAIPDGRQKDAVYAIVADIAGAHEVLYRLWNDALSLMPHLQPADADALPPGVMTGPARDGAGDPAEPDRAMPAWIDLDRLVDDAFGIAATMLAAGDGMSSNADLVVMNYLGRHVRELAEALAALSRPDPAADDAPADGMADAAPRTAA